MIDKEDLGGYAVHTRISGVVDNVAENEPDAIAQVKRFLSYLPDNVWEMPPRADSSDDPKRRDERLLTLIPRSKRRPYDTRVIIEGVLDEGSFFEIAAGLREVADHRPGACARLSRRGAGQQPDSAGRLDGCRRR